MKNIIPLLTAALLLGISLSIRAQGYIYVYDQQSATNAVTVLNNGNADGLDIQTEPLTQSFVPTLSLIDFVQLELADFPGNGTSGVTMYVNIWTGSANINLATLVGSSASVYLTDGFVNSGLGVAGIATFLFSSTLTLIAGQTYYIQPVVVSGDNPWDVIAIGNAYANGQLYASGYCINSDLWFREGIIAVPEPSTLALVAVGGGMLALGWRRQFISKLLEGAAFPLIG